MLDRKEQAELILSAIHQGRLDITKLGLMPFSFGLLAIRAHYAGLNEFKGAKMPAPTQPPA